MTEEKIGIIIPAYNEGAMLGKTIRALKRHIPKVDILVVDDGSQDRTGKIAIDEGAKLLTLGENMGKGRALREGLKSIDRPIIVFVDADIGESAGEINKLIFPILDGTAQATVGKIEFTPGMGGFGLVKNLSRKAFKYLTGNEFKSVLSGQRAFKKEVLKEEYLDYKGFGVEFGMTVDLSLDKISILEVPLAIKHRVTGKDLRGYLHRGKQFWDILKVFLAKLKIKGHEGVG